MSRLSNGEFKLLEQHIRDFLQSLNANPVYSQSTYLAYQTDLSYFLSFLHQHLGHAPQINDFDAQQVAQFLDFERQEGRSRNTLMRRRATLRSLANYLNKNCQSIANFDQASPALIGVDQDIREVHTNFKQQILSSREIDALHHLMEASSHPRARRDQAIFALILECGISVGRLVELDTTDFVQTDGKWRVCINKGLGRWIELSSSTSYLKRYLAEGRPDLNPTSELSAYFISQMGKRISRQGIWQILDHWGQLLQPPIKLSPRLIRKTAVHELHQSGCQAKEIKNLLGHTNFLSTKALLRRLNSPIENEIKT
jgi:integrase/recombinase XerD